MANHGYVYLLGNPAMPGIYKIGKTTGSPYKRAEMLSYGSGVPMPFTVLAWVQCEDFSRFESTLHSAFCKYRINARREFFKFGANELVWVWGCFHHLPDQLNYGLCNEWKTLLERYSLPNPIDYDEEDWFSDRHVRVMDVHEATASHIGTLEVA